MKRVPHPTWIEIDFGQFLTNLKIVRTLIGNRKLCFPVKANGYGHGLVGMGRAAEPFVDCLAVSCLQEGALLRQAGIEKPILVLGAIHEDQVDGLIDLNLEFSISSQLKADFVAKRLKKRCPVHLEVETGMQRTGVRSETALKLIQHLRSLDCFEVVGVYSHLATADIPNDPFALKQIEAFRTLVGHPLFRGLCTHLANSGGVAFYPDSYLDMVRPGRLLFGYLPPNPPASLLEIAPCFSLKSRVSYFKVVEGGVGISYGHTYRTKRETRVVTVPIGYGDGYRRSLSNRGSVLIRGKKFQISGTICMDQFMVDVGDQEVYVGDEVVLIGKQGSEEISLSEVASLCDTTTYELLCQFNDRIPRISSKE